MPKKKRSQNNLRRRRYIPVELVEKIALHLPVKSLLRFSTVSRSWRSTILSPEFAKRYRGGEMIVLRTADNQSLVCPLSSLSSHNPTDNAAPFPCPLTVAENPYFLASCGKLWCVEIEKYSLYLYNPSTRTRRRLPDPSAMGCSAMGSLMSVFVYGLGYDAVGDDYKLLRLHRSVGLIESEVYSQVSNCWREVSLSKFWSSIPTPGDLPRIVSPNGVFVGGALHWLMHHAWEEAPFQVKLTRAILSFDVSMKEFAVVPLPVPLLSPASISGIRQLDVTVLRGMLGVCNNRGHRFVVWVMKERGSWTKELDLSFAHIRPLCFSYYLRPLFFYDHTGDNLIKAFTSSTDTRKIFIYKPKEDEEDDAPTPSLPLPLVEKSFGRGVLDHFTYVESFVKP